MDWNTHVGLNKIFGVHLQELGITSSFPVQLVRVRHKILACIISDLFIRQLDLIHSLL